MSDQHFGTVVIGGGQAGLAVGYFLKKRGLPFVILDENERAGDAWRKRWGSLRLFTPRTSFPLLAELGAGGRCGTGCRVHRRPHRIHAAVKNGGHDGQRDNRQEATCVTGSPGCS